MRVHIAGYLGADPELRITPQGVPVCSFRIAENIRRRNEEGADYWEVQWWDIRVWGSDAVHVAETLKKGYRVMVDGDLRVERWKDRDGNTRYSNRIYASEVAASLRRQQVQVDRVEASQDAEEDDEDQ